jgi:hypothetical protein
MSKHDEIPEDLKALEAALRGLAPAPAALDQNALMFRAGQASARRQQWAWQSLAAAALLLSAGLGTLVAAGPGRERIVYVEVEKKPADLPAPAPQKESPDVRPVRATGELAQGSYLDLRKRWAATEGDSEEWLPRPAAPAPTRPFSRDELLN